MEESLVCDPCKVRFETKKAFEIHLSKREHQLTLHDSYIWKAKERCGIFISGFPNLVPKEDIIKFIHNLAPIKSVHIGTGNKFAIVELLSEADAQKLLSMGEVQFMGRSLSIKPRRMKNKSDAAILKYDEDIDTITESVNYKMSFIMQLQTLLVNLQPDQMILLQKYHQLCSDLNFIMQAVFPGCAIYPFGSTITGLNFKRSDVDVYVDVRMQSKDNEAQSKAAEYCRKAKKIFYKYSQFNNVVAIPRAKTPIVKCVHVATSIKCDFNFKNMLGVCNSYLIRYYLGLDPTIKPMLMFLKFWGRVHNLTGISGKFSNYALTMMFIFYLQQKPYRLPTVVEMQLSPFKNIQDGWNGGFRPIINIGNVLNNQPAQNVLHGFFDFYLNFDYSVNVICPYLGKIIPRADFTKPNSLTDHYINYKNYCMKSNNFLQIDTPVCIQDPFEHNHNLAKAVSEKIAEEFVSLCKMSTIKLQPDGSMENNILYQLLTEEPDDITFKQKERNCEFKIQMGKVSPYLERKIQPGVKDKAAEIRKCWYDIVNQFIVTVLMKVFKFEVRVEKGTEAKAQTTHNSSGLKIVDSVIFNCIGMVNVWDARKSISKDMELNNETLILDQQIQITNYIFDMAYGNVETKTPILEFSLTMNAIEKPVGVDITLTKSLISRGNFPKFASIFVTKLPSWFKIYMEELNRSAKKTFVEDISDGDLQKN